MDRSYMDSHFGHMIGDIMRQSQKCSNFTFYLQFSTIHSNDFKGKMHRLLGDWVGLGISFWENERFWNLGNSVSIKRKTVLEVFGARLFWSKSYSIRSIRVGQLTKWNDVWQGLNKVVTWSWFLCNVKFDETGRILRSWIICQFSRGKTWIEIKGSHLELFSVTLSFKCSHLELLSVTLSFCCFGCCFCFLQEGKITRKYSSRGLKAT